MDVKHIGGIVGFDLDKRRDRTFLSVARPKIDSQDIVVELLGDRDTGVMGHPGMVVVGPEDQPPFLPPHLGLYPLDL